MGDFEVLAEELEGEAEEGLVLRWCYFEAGKGDKNITRIRWVSGFSFEVMWSAIMLWMWEGTCSERTGGLVLI